MGIEGLLKLLDPITIKQHISTFQGQTAAVDILSWIYKGCYRCTYEHNQNIESNNFLYYIFQMLDLLSYYNIKPICVFDGRHVGKKNETLEKRKKTKEQNKKKGLQCLQQGNQQQGRKYLSRCIIIDERILATTMRALYTKKVQFMVAPYQSDSQLAKLIQLKQADFAICQDSDLIVYGVKAVLKLNPDGDCDFIDVYQWKPEDIRHAFLKKYLQLDYLNRVDAAILAGSDYNKSVKGIGIKKSVKHIYNNKSLNQAIQFLRGQKTFQQLVPVDYQKTVLQSKLIFILATVYNTVTKKLQFLNQNLFEVIKPTEMTQQQILNIVGPHYEYNEQMMNGMLNTKTLQPRFMYQIDFKTFFSLNAESLIVKQSLNKRRREQQKQAKQRRYEQRQQMINSGIPLDQIDRPTSNRKKMEPKIKIQLTDELKKLKTAEMRNERQNRLKQMKQMLGSLVFPSQSSQQSQITPEDDYQQPYQYKSNKKIDKAEQIEKVEKSDKIAKSPATNSMQQMQEQQQSSKSEQIFLQQLNPWIKSSKNKQCLQKNK